MRFLADENIPLLSVRLLREEGHDVSAVSEFAPEMIDEVVLATARKENRVLITLDRDFGELVYHRGAPVPFGIIYLRRLTSGNAVSHAVNRVLRSPSVVIAGHFIVVEDDKIRQRPLPPS